MNRFLIIGAGRSGRGFIARLLHRHGDILFSDKDPELLLKLREAGSYSISFFSDRSDERIENYDCISMDDPLFSEKVKNVSHIFVSVGSKNVSDVLLFLSSIPSLSGTSIYICENGIFSTDELPILRERSSLGLIFCSTTDHGTDIISEDMDILYLDDLHRDAILDSFPELRFTGSFESLIRRKIYTYNAASAIIGFLGKDRGYEYLGDAANEDFISSLLDTFYDEIDVCMCEEYGVAPEEQEAFSLASRRKFLNRRIADPVDRNIRDPKNKLLPSERLIGSLNLLLKYDRIIDPIALTIASAARRTGEAATKEGFVRMLRDHCLLDDETVSKLLPFFVA